jgi:hypothetical protein
MLSPITKIDYVISAPAVCIHDGTTQAGNPGRVVRVGNDINAPLRLQAEQERDDTCCQGKKVFKPSFHEDMLLYFANFISFVNDIITTSPPLKTNRENSFLEFPRATPYLFLTKL